jgi:molecular chaperone DnaK (HSP70)
MTEIKDIVDQYFDDDNIEPIIEKKEEEIVVGIDFGTTNSSICIWRNEKYEMITDEFGHTSIPSVVAITNYTKYVGFGAKNQKDINPQNVYYEIKRLMGKKITDETVINDMEFMTYPIVGDENNNIKINSNFIPEQIASYILLKLKEMANDYLKTEVKKAVITVPAYFNDTQRQATKNAAEIAGLECIRILSEPISSALAYGMVDITINEQSKKEVNVVVYDLGGGTLDVSLIKISNGLFEVLASAGNTHLGGSDFDVRLMRHAISVFKIENNLDDLSNLSNFSIQELRKSCERAKKILSNSPKTIIAVQKFYNDKHLVVPITVEKMEEICNDLILLCIKPLQDVLNSCNLKKENVDYTLLVGGMTKMFSIRNNIRNFFGKLPYCHIDPECTVAIGAAIQGFMLSHKEEPFANNVILLDNTPLSLGVETIGGIMNIIIPRNTIIPTTKTKYYTTDTDYETSVTIKVFEGERYLSKDNTKVGEFELTNIEKAPRGIPEIEVKITIDADGIIHISAKDLKNGENNSIIITGKMNNLTKEQILKLIDDANQMEIMDHLEKIKKQSYIELNDICSNILYNISDSECHVNNKEEIEKEIKEIRKWYENILETELLIEKIEYVKNTYGNLIFKIVKNIEEMKTIEKNEINCTNIFEDDDEKLFEKLNGDELFQKINIDTIGINESKEQLMQLCNDIYNIIKLSSITLSDEDKKDMISYIDDVLLWIYVEQIKSPIDVKMKISEVNQKCDLLFSKNPKIEINIKDELINICTSINVSIHSNLFSCSEDLIKELENKVEIINKITNETSNEQLIQLKNELEEICNKIYKSMITN